MVKNFIKVALRNLQNNKLYSFINVAGLAVGIACCLLISIFIWHELSYDQHHKDGERIFRITNEVRFNDSHLKLATAPAPLMEATLKEFVEVEHAVRFRNRGSFIISKEDKKFKEEDVIMADSSVFNVFSIPMISGNPSTALKEPNTLVISESLAEKLFGHTEVVNETLILDNDKNYKITGVFENMPENSHFNFNMMIAMAELEEAKSNNWVSNNFHTYAKLRKGTSPEKFEQKLELLAQKYVSPQMEQALGVNIDQFREKGNILSFSIQPIKDIHLHSDMMAELEANGDITYVYLFAAIALFILIIACINFMNLSTARSANRAKEVGIRKVLGSYKSYLIKQFLSESILLTAIAFIIGLAIAQIALPYFNDLSGKILQLPFNSLVFWGVVILSVILIGILAGFYPAFFLSSFKPSTVLKSNKSKAGGNSAFIRSTLVIFQFSISIILIVGTIVVFKQLNFIQNKNLGFNREQIIIVKDAYGLQNNFEAFKQEVLKNPDIISGTATGFLPAGGTSLTDMTLWKEGEQPTEENLVSTQFWRVDHDYLETLQMELVEGRNFNPQIASDSNAIIINEAAVKAYGLKNPTESSLLTFKYDFEKGEVARDEYDKIHVIGVVKDFHFQSLKDEVKPLALNLSKSRSLYAFRFKAEKSQQVINHIENKWQQMSGGQPFLYSFMDDDFEKIYTNEMRLGRIFSVFAILAIFIACLGLFALSSFTAEQRIKEIGVRKVLGASVQSIVLLFTKDFSRLVLIAFLVAVPIAWFAVDYWLQNYTYRTEISLSIYFLAGIATLLIAVLTMSFQSIRAAIANPVDSLKHE